MRKTCLLLAVLLAANGSLCRADDKPDTDAKKDAGKDYVEAIGAKDTAACIPAMPKKSGIIIPFTPRCHSGRSLECYHKLVAWITYCPLQKSTGCCHKCTDCAPPPLYTYFLDPYHACGSANGCAACEKPGCGAWAHR
jgi:hypothetical protein